MLDSGPVLTPAAELTAENDGDEPDAVDADVGIELFPVAMAEEDGAAPVDGDAGVSLG